LILGFELGRSGISATTNQPRWRKRHITDYQMLFLPLNITDKKSPMRTAIVLKLTVLGKRFAELRILEDEQE
jgi:hypothetical protein